MSCLCAMETLNTPYYINRKEHKTMDNVYEKITKRTSDDIRMLDGRLARVTRDVIHELTRQ